jgi:tRNA nucleotidyltransferase (CCA-adding enzyme)
MWGVAAATASAMSAGPADDSSPSAAAPFNADAAERVREVLSDPKLVLLGDIFRQNGHEIRLAGGVVRDLLSGKSPQDIDLCTPATPEEMAGPDGLGGGFLHGAAGISKVVPTGLQHGTVTVVIDKEPFEITTLRIDTSHDGRHCEVQFTTSWKLDAERRDLTINAMMMDLSGNLYDYFGGQQDLHDKIVRFVGVPAERLAEDYLRILRYFRFHGRINGTAMHDEACSRAIREGAVGLQRISGERIRSEMVKILSHPVSTVDELEAMHAMGVTSNIAMPVLDQRHCGELSRVAQHINDPITRLASLVDTIE